MRSEVYKILSRCFQYPNDEFFRYAKKKLLVELGRSLHSQPFNEAIKESYALFRSALKEQVKKFSLDDLQIEYTALFIYSRGGPICPIYESMYREKNKSLMGEPAMDVKRLYKSFKLRVSRSFADLPDHISAELEFMHFLIANEIRFTANRQKHVSDFFVESERAFLGDHAIKWIPQFADCLEEKSVSEFFITLSKLTTDFLIADTELLAGRDEAPKTESLTIDRECLDLDTSTLKVLEEDEGTPDPQIKWAYTTSTERYWTGIPYAPVKVKVVEGKATQIVPRDDVPFYDGKQDVRAFACLGKLYAPDKLKFPLKRVGKRGAGKFKRISWDEALSEISNVLKRYRDEGNARYVGFMRTHPPLEFLFNHFTHHYGSPNDVHTSTTSCYADGKIAAVLTGSSDLGTDDYLNTNYSLYIGHNLLNGIRSIPKAARFAEAIRRGMKFVFVDPRLNEGSYTYGSEWVPIKPGTDGALVLSLIHILIKEKLFDEDFLLRHTNAPILIQQDGYLLKDKNEEYLVWDNSIGDVRPLSKALEPALMGRYDVKLDTYQGVCATVFQQLAEHVEIYSAQEAAHITTIEEEKIEEIARDLGTMKPHVCIYSYHAVSAQYTNSLQYCRARNVLMCLLGIFDKPGGKHFGTNGPHGICLNKGSDFRVPIRVHPMTAERVDFDPTLHPLLTTKTEEDFPVGVVQHFLRAIKTGKPYPIKALFIIGSDVSASHSSEWREAFNELEFMVKSHVWPDDDVDYADIVLPEAAYLERDDGFAVVSVHDPSDKNSEFSFLSVVQKIVEPQFEERPWTDYVKELSEKLGFAEYYEFTLDEYWNFLLEPMGIDIDYLRKHGVYYPDSTVTRKIEFSVKDRWDTDTGRLNIYCNEMVDLWYQSNKHPRFNPLPTYHPISIEPLAENEFYLINGKCSYFQCNFYRNNPMLLEEYLEGELGNTLLWMNTKKAAALGIKDRDCVWIESEQTGFRDKVKVKATEGIHPSAVWHVYGYGHRSKLMDRRSRGREGINVNDFIPERSVPWTAGQAHCEAIVRVYRTE